MGKTFAAAAADAAAINSAAIDSACARAFFVK
jgi:hypothetical protein